MLCTRCPSYGMLLPHLLFGSLYIHLSPRLFHSLGIILLFPLGILALCSWTASLDICCLRLSLLGHFLSLESSPLEFVSTLLLHLMLFAFTNIQYPLSKFIDFLLFFCVVRHTGFVESLLPAQQSSHQMAFHCCSGL